MNSITGDAVLVVGLVITVCTDVDLVDCIVFRGGEGELLVALDVIGLQQHYTTTVCAVIRSAAGFVVQMPADVRHSVTANH